MSEFDGDPKITGSPADEIDKRRQLTRLEIGSHLDEHRSELVTQLPGAIEERLRGAGLVAESVLVRDLLRHLQRKHESLRSTIEPASYRRRGRRRVERGIHFHRVERARINSKKIGWPRACRIERSNPGVVIPALCADMNLRGHDVQSEAATSRCQVGRESSRARVGISSRALGSRFATP